MSESAVDPRRAQSGRSPSYPGIPLGDAIERARTVWGREKQNPTLVAVVVKHWGYSNPTSGRASVTFAALKKFGLITEEGTGAGRIARLTDRCKEILLNPDASAAIREAALLPPIHRELWTEYGEHGLPSDESLKWTLIKRGFTESGAAEFIRQFKETIAYARLDEADPGNPGEEEAGDDDEREVERKGGEQGREDRRPRRRSVSGDTLSIPVPIIGGEAVIVEGQFPITEAAWTQFMAVLNAMKPGLVQPDDTPSSDTTIS